MAGRPGASWKGHGRRAGGVSRAACIRTPPAPIARAEFAFAADEPPVFRQRLFADRVAPIRPLAVAATDNGLAPERAAVITCARRQPCAWLRASPEDAAVATIIKTSTSYFACASPATTAATLSSIWFQPST